MTYRMHVGIVLVFMAVTMASCGDSEPARMPLAPAPAPPSPSAASDLLVFMDRDGFRTSEVRDRDEQIVQFTTKGELVWAADGTRFPGYRSAGNESFGYVLAPTICPYCAYEIRFGTSDGQRRAYLTLDRGEDNPGTIVDLEVVHGELRTSQTEVGPPGTFTLSGQVVEVTGEGSVPVPFVRISSNRYNWYAAASDANGFYRLPWLDAGRYSISVTREGYERQIRPLVIDGDTQSDFTLVRH